VNNHVFQCGHENIPVSELDTYNIDENGSDNNLDIVVSELERPVEEPSNEFSDTCGGQNHNQFFFTMIIYALQNSPNITRLTINFVYGVRALADGV